MSDDLVSRLKRLARIARRALETNKCMSIWCADPDTLDAAAIALTEARAEIARLKSGINGIVNCQGPMTRAQVREVCAEILDNKTVGLNNQSPFAEAMFGNKARAEKAESALAELTPVKDMLALCGELGGMGTDEAPADYLRRLIDGLIVGRPPAASSHPRNQQSRRSDAET